MSRIKKDEALINDIYKTLEGKEVVTGSNEVFDKHLPAVGEVQITPEIVEGVNDYVCKFSASSVEAIGRYAVEQMGKDKDLKNVTGSIGMGSFGEVSVDVTREREVTVAGNTSIVKGGSRVDVSFVAGKNSGALAKARQTIKDLANDAL